MKPIHPVWHGAADWNPVRQEVAMLFRGLSLLALGFLLTAYAFYEVATHWTLHGGSGHEGAARSSWYKHKSKWEITVEYIRRNGAENAADCLLATLSMTTIERKLRAN